jgi:hypothetical protein
LKSRLLDRSHQTCYYIPIAKDINQIGHSIMEKTTNQITTPPKKNPAAVALGRLGGLKGGPARAAKLTKEKLQEIAAKAAQARWSK